MSATITLISFTVSSSWLMKQILALFIDASPLDDHMMALWDLDTLLLTVLAHVADVSSSPLAVPENSYRCSV